MPKRTCPAPLPTSRKKAKSVGQTDAQPPHITSRVVCLSPKSQRPSGLLLQGKRGEVYNMLLKECEDIENDPLRKAEKLKVQTRISAAIGIMSVMDERKLAEMDIPDATSFAGTLGLIALEMLERWAKSGTKQSKTERLPETISAQNEVATWYRNKCVITGVEEPTEACHILANVIERYDRGLRCLLHSLKFFWPTEKYEKLRLILGDPLHQRTNLIILRSDIHDLWDNHRFCLRPDEGQEDTTLELEFLWLHRSRSQTHSVSFQTPNPDGHTITLPEGRCSQGAVSVMSGDRIILGTDDPTNHPLPSRAILELQYNLHMALCASAAAEVITRIFRKDTLPPKVLANNNPMEGIDDEDDEGVEAPYFVESLLGAAIALELIEPGDVLSWRLAFSPKCPDPSVPLWTEPTNYPL